jgi:hypothetical protein
MADSPTVTESPGTDASPVASAPETPVASTATPSSDADGGSSPQRPAAETRESLLEAIQKVAPSRDAPERAPQEEGAGDRASPAQGAKPGEEPLGDLTEQEIESYHPKTRKRIRQLTRDLAATRTELSTASALAQTTTDLQAYLQYADIAKEDFSLLLDLGAALRRGDFRTFLAGVAPYVELAQQSLGITLPADLAQAVQTGHMTQEAASWAAQQRSQLQLAEAWNQRVAQASHVEAQGRQRAELQSNVANAVASWENGIRRSDPDYARKEPVIRDLLHAVVQERGPPQNPAEAIEIAKAAYARANQALARFSPQPRRTQPSPSSINRAAGGARQEPRTLMEAAQAALERTVQR